MCIELVRFVFDSAVILIKNVLGYFSRYIELDRINSGRNSENQVFWWNKKNRSKIWTGGKRGGVCLVCIEVGQDYY